MPFSDPLADGPTIQRSTFDALQQGMTLPRTLELIAEARLTRPVVIFSYLNPILRYGLERFLRDAAELGVAGLLLTDLPAGQRSRHRARGAPRARSTSSGWSRRPRPDPACATWSRGAEGFLYLVARLGVTGARARLWRRTRGAT